MSVDRQDEVSQLVWDSVVLTNWHEGEHHLYIEICSLISLGFFNKERNFFSGSFSTWSVDKKVHFFWQDEEITGVVDLRPLIAGFFRAKRRWDLPLWIWMIVATLFGLSFHRNWQPLTDLSKRENQVISDVIKVATLFSPISLTTLFWMNSKQNMASLAKETLF